MAKREADRERAGISKLSEQKSEAAKSISKLEFAERDLKQRLEKVGRLVEDAEQRLKEYHAAKLTAHSREMRSQRTEEQKLKHLDCLSKMVEEKDATLSRLNQELGRKEEKLRGYKDKLSECKAQIQSQSEDSGKLAGTCIFHEDSAA